MASWGVNGQKDAVGGAGSDVRDRPLDLSSLDAQQHDAVAAPLDRTALVAAGPGTGKTRVLTYRVAYLLDQGVLPQQIAVVTFTKKAAGELQDRLLQLVPNVQDLAIGTIHSICYSLLRNINAKRGVTPSICTDPRTHLRGLLEAPSPMYPKALGIPGLDIGKVSQAVALYKDHLGHDDGEYTAYLANLVDQGSYWFPPRKLLELCQVYQEELSKRGQIDFEDMYCQLATPSNRGLVANQYTHILIDEFQDTSYGQFEVLRNLGRYLYCVGDVSQSMYQFRGARPEFMLHFASYYPDAQVYYVGTNYRSVPKVVEAAQNLIRHSKERLDLTLSPHRNEPGTVRVQPANDIVGESAAILRAINDWHAQGVTYKDMAVLYRVGWYNAVVEIDLVKEGVPYHVVGGVSFFGRRPVLDLLAYLQVIYDPTAPESLDALLRILNVPKRYLGKSFAEKLRSYAQKNDGCDVLELLELAAEKPHEKRGVADLLRVIQEAKSCRTAGETIQSIRHQTGYDRWFLEYYGTDQDTDSVVWLDVLVGLSSEWTVKELLDHAESMSGASEEGADEVTLSTIHRAKGLEWPCVAVMGLSDGLLPHAKGDYEEERRIAFVALTRARDHLLVTYPLSVRDKVVEPSPFLQEANLYQYQNP